MDVSFLKPVPVQGKVRLGTNRDGGYVVYKRLLDKTDILFTYGVGFEVSFEEDFNALTKKRVVMFDPTLFGKYLVDFKKAFKYITQLKFISLVEYLVFVGSCWRKLKELNGRRIKFVNEGLSANKSGKYTTFQEHIERFIKNEREIFLKIDIEGNEYEVLSSAHFYKNLRHVNQIVIEFHNLKNQLRTLQKIMKKLLRDYYLIHIHGNNCSEVFKIYHPDSNDIHFPDTIEVTLVKKEKLHKNDLLPNDIKYPVSGLDFPNNPGKKDYELCFSV
jgi:hypothetical protein